MSHADDTSEPRRVLELDHWAEVQEDADGRLFVAVSIGKEGQHQAFSLRRPLPSRDPECIARETIEAWHNLADVLRQVAANIDGHATVLVVEP